MKKTLITALLLVSSLVSTSAIGSECYDFKYNMAKFGTIDGPYFDTDQETQNEVSKLQQFLREEGSLVAPVLPVGTAVYGAVTMTAVKRFQAKYFSTTPGVVGPSTRKMIKDLTCYPTATAPTNINFDISSANVELNKNMTWTWIANNNPTSYRYGIDSTDALNYNPNLPNVVPANLGTSDGQGKFSWTTTPKALGAIVGKRYTILMQGCNSAGCSPVKAQFITVLSDSASTTAPGTMCNSEQNLVNGKCENITVPYVCPDGTTIRVPGNAPYTSHASYCAATTISQVTVNTSLRKITVSGTNLGGVSSLRYAIRLNEGYTKGYTLETIALQSSNQVVFTYGSITAGLLAESGGIWDIYLMSRLSQQVATTAWDRGTVGGTVVIGTTPVTGGGTVTGSVTVSGAPVIDLSVNGVKVNDKGTVRVKGVSDTIVWYSPTAKSCSINGNQLNKSGLSEVTGIVPGKYLFACKNSENLETAIWFDVISDAVTTTGGTGTNTTGTTGTTNTTTSTPSPFVTTVSSNAPPSINASLVPSSITGLETASLVFQASTARHCNVNIYNKALNQTQALSTFGEMQSRPTETVTLKGSDYPQGATISIACVNSSGETRAEKSLVVTAVQKPVITAMFSPESITSSGSSQFSYAAFGATSCNVNVTNKATNSTGAWNTKYGTDTSELRVLSGASYPSGAKISVSCANTGGVTTVEKTLTVNGGTTGTVTSPTGAPTNTDFVISPLTVELNKNMTWTWIANNNPTSYRYGINNYSSTLPNVVEAGVGSKDSQGKYTWATTPSTLGAVAGTSYVISMQGCNSSGCSPARNQIVQVINDAPVAPVNNSPGTLNLIFSINGTRISQGQNFNVNGVSDVVSWSASGAKTCYMNGSDVGAVTGVSTLAGLVTSSHRFECVDANNSSTVLTFSIYK